MRSVLKTLTLGIVGLIAGCAAPPEIAAPIDDIHRDRIERRDHALQQFDASRADAQFQAARELWLREDHAGCGAMLEQIVQQNPQHCEARRLLADVYLVEHHEERAAAQLRQIVALHDNDHQAHHSLGLLLMGTGADNEAQAHLRRAVELVPDNAVYRSSLAALSASNAFTR